jgi:hypothetical protein
MTRTLMVRVLAVGAVALGLLSGCAPKPADMAANAAKELQSAVAAVTQSAADGDIVAAITNLDALERRLSEATASGDISAGRSAKIEASISLVRADLTAALPPPPPTPTPTVTVLIPPPGSNSGANNTDGKGDDKGKDKGGGKGGGKGDK